MLETTGIDIIEDEIIDYSPKLFSILLKDRTTNSNIIWATEDYTYMGELYNPHLKITKDLISGENRQVIQPRALKSKDVQTDRTKTKGEVFTPSWVCNLQNNLIDKIWFGQENVFNYAKGQSWITSHSKIHFSENPKRGWKNYVDERRLEIACGEAQYLVSRYDSLTGKKIPLMKRIGLLDRKMRVVHENTSSEEEWIKWSIRAFESIYGYEFQGDSLLLARENLLLTYIEYMKEKLNRKPELKELTKISTIISWNLWQMDGLSYTVPYQDKIIKKEQLAFFETNKDEDIAYCKIKDWRSKKVIQYKKMLTMEV
ncbi:restriction endonuclease subunit M [Exiguobacterium sp. SH0S1]|uniref:restriction endonuclease subunit M n=1 Tax=Exiguobacterium sp. SH0S1 TaxID=2510949 RepID=UPI00103FEAA4|nr:restriction endonuclease subunit M [Exiguobacterium sp. SH0S1]TCI75699.1 restriction endonuclease subunit M [Exiguobacterium sp. SH0S1]